VESSVDNLELWITYKLSTILPQQNAIYPQFCPQPQRRLFSVDKGHLASIHTIHRPYYYYYSKKLMV
jgi:hypothetical protein